MYVVECERMFDKCERVSDGVREEVPVKARGVPPYVGGILYYVGMSYSV